MTNTDFKKALDAAKAALNTATGNRSTIETLISEATTRRAALAQSRNPVLMVAAKVGDARAQKMLAATNDEIRRVETEIAELQEALTHTGSQILDAKKAIATADAEAGREAAKELYVLRINAARRIDAAFAELASAYDEFVPLGNKIATYGCADIVTVNNPSDIVGAMPKCFDQISQGRIIRPGYPMSLEQKERSRWGIAQ